MKLPLSAAALVILLSDIKNACGEDITTQLYKSIAPPCESTLSYNYDSGDITSTTGTVVEYKGVPCIQLDLTGTYLAPKTKLLLVGESTSEIISNNDSLNENGYTAYFIGQSVRVELRYENGRSCATRHL